MTNIRIKNWKEFQHFKDRSPPWIKLYRENLYRRDIMLLSERNFKILVCLWMLASEAKTQDGQLPEIADIAYTLRYTELEIAQAIKDLQGFLDIDDINLISQGYQHDAPETETYSKETETEYINASLKKYFPRPDDVDKKVWDLFLQHRKARKSVVNEIVIKGFRREADKAGIILQEAIEIAIERGWTGFKAEWVNNNTKTERLDHAIQVAVDRIKSNRREIKSIGSDSVPVLQRVQSLRQDP